MLLFRVVLRVQGLKVGKLVDGNEGTSQLVPGLGRIIVEGSITKVYIESSKLATFLSDT